MAQAIQFNAQTLDFIVDEQKLTNEDLNLLNNITEAGVEYYFLRDFKAGELPWALFDKESFEQHFVFIGPQFVGKFQEIKRKD